MSFDQFLDRYFAAIKSRNALTNHELTEAWNHGLDPVDIARDNDNLVAEYDADHDEEPYADNFDAKPDPAEDLDPDPDPTDVYLYWDSREE